MTMTNAEWMIKHGYKFRELDWICSKTVTYDYDILLNNKCIGKVKDSYSNKAIATWLDMEHVEPILDDAEKRYLSAVIRPFRERVWYIRKAVADDTSVYKCSYYIFIRFNEGTDDMKFPVFHKSNMYKGMSTARTYTPEELGI